MTLKIKPTCGSLELDIQELARAAFISLQEKLEIPKNANYNGWQVDPSGLTLTIHYNYEKPEETAK